SSMTCALNLRVQGQIRKTRVFSLRGCYLIAVLSKTRVAKKFRKWVLDVLEKHNQQTALPAPTSGEEEIKKLAEQQWNFAVDQESLLSNVQDAISKVISEIGRAHV